MTVAGRRRTLATAVLSLAMALLVLSGSGPASAAVHAAAAQPTTVRMIHFTFDPATVTIPVGSTVTWAYAESATDPQPGCESPEFRLVPGVSCPGHSTTAVQLGPNGKPLWDSGVHRAEGFPYSHTFTKPGTYAYYCTIHGGPNPNNPLTAMNGTIVVTAASAGAAVVLGSSSTAASVTSAPASGALPATGGTDTLGVGVVVLLGALAALGVRRHAR